MHTHVSPSSFHTGPIHQPHSLIAITRLSQPALSADLDGPIAGAGILAAVVNNLVIFAVPDMLARDDPIFTRGASSRIPRLETHALTSPNALRHSLP
jgi:hypothetical protein